MVELRKEMGYATPEEKSNPDDPQEVQPPLSAFFGRRVRGALLFCGAKFHVR
jgi:hypothetical protein